MLINAEIRSAFHQDRQLERKVTDVQPQRDQHTGEVSPFRFTPGCLIALSSTYRRSLSFCTSPLSFALHISLTLFPNSTSNGEQDEFGRHPLQIPQNSSINVAGIPPHRSRFFRFFRSKALREICRLRFLLCPFAPSQLIQFDIAITLIEVPRSSTLSLH